MADNKPSNRERIKEIVTGIEAGIQDLFQRDKFADYLRTMSRFHNYSYNNTILIHMQMPSATHVAGFNKWKNQFERHVKKGEKGLTIIAPTPFKKRIEEMKLDPDTRAPVLDHDGNVIMEEREIEIPLFRPVKVFDVSQTEGRPLPSLVAPLTGDVQQYEAFMEALRRTSPVPVQFKPLREGLDGFLSLNYQTITIREGMSQVQTVCAAVHEITHAMLHNREQEQLTAAAGITDREPPKPKDKNTKEVEAESVSYTVCQYYGIETSANSLGYIATWSKDKTLPELKASLETISKTANILITSIDRHFAEICRERGIDLTAQQ
uniref:ArdC-like ssDNA-binding domain-containing protein n=1 Tax=uncultured Oscillibacter sp. TaxID=876091 RepID=UPI00263650B1